MGIPKSDDDLLGPDRTFNFRGDGAKVQKFKDSRAKAAYLRLEAYELRKASHSFQEIAQIQGVGVATAARRYEQAVKQYIPAELVDTVRRMELDRYDALQKMLLPLIADQIVVSEDDGRTRLRDVDTFAKLFDRYVAVSDRRVKLTGAQAPVQVQIDGTIVQQSEQDRELQQLLREAAAANAEMDAMADAGRQEDTDDDPR